MDIAVIATDKTVLFALRALQFLFAIVVMGTDGYGTMRPSLLPSSTG
jgi:hypothetical protein